MNAIIIDDQQKSIDILKELIESFCPDIHLLGEAGTLLDARDLLQTNIYKLDLVFLDIELPDGSGFELMEEFYNSPTQVIFTTAHSQYALQAIRAAALDYLLKPIDLNELQNAVDRAREQKNKVPSIHHVQHMLKHLTEWHRGNRRLALTHKKGSTILELQNIIRFEAAGNYCYVYPKNMNRFLISKNIGQLEEIVKDVEFHRPHRSHLINLSYLQGFRKNNAKYELIVNGQPIAIPKGKWKNLQKKLNLIC